MILYQAGMTGSKLDGELLKLPSANRLIPYDCHKQRGMKTWLSTTPSKAHRLFVDSGAYSAFQQGFSIDVGEYADFLLKNNERITSYLNLDDIAKPENSHKNLLYLESRGLTPIPVHNARESLQNLEQLLEKHEYVAIGGLVALMKMSKEGLLEVLDQKFTLIMKYWPRKVHLLGTTSTVVTLRYPCYSCDSSSAVQSGGRSCKLTTFVKGEMKITPFRSRKKVGTPLAIDFGEKAAYLQRILYNISEFKKLENYITKIWERRGIKW